MRFVILFISLGIQLGLAQENTSKTTSLDFQNELNKEFSTRETSPLTKEDFKDFKGLDFYPISEKFIVTAKFKKLKNQKEFEMKTSTSRTPKYLKYGLLTFKIDGKKHQLFVYQNIELTKVKGNEKDLFLPFSDKTSGNDTYIGGRYIDLKIPEGDAVIIDFNTAYNPYCAYNHLYSCPLVPMENDLSVEILAGVKKFHE